MELSDEIGLKLDVPISAPKGGLCEPGHGSCVDRGYGLSLRCNFRIALQCAQAPRALLEDWNSRLGCDMLSEKYLERP